jgi:chromosome segregation ATPase
MASRSKLNEELRHAERLLSAARNVQQTHLQRRFELERQQDEIKAKIKRLDADLESAPAMEAQALAQIAQIKAQLGRLSETGSVSEPPRKHEPKTQTEKLIDRRARIMRELATIENTLESN